MLSGSVNLQIFYFTTVGEPDIFSNLKCNSRRKKQRKEIIGTVKNDRPINLLVSAALLQGLGSWGKLKSSAF